MYVSPRLCILVLIKVKMKLRDALNIVNKEFGLRNGRECIIALWNKRMLRNFKPEELEKLYVSILIELRECTSKKHLTLLRKLKTKTIEVIVDGKFKKEGNESK